MSSIYRLPLSRKERLVSFMNANWGSEHPLINNPVFFEYYYVDGDMTNFYVLEEGGEIIAVCGYIPSSHEKDSDIWISIWLRKKGHNGAGLELMGNMMALTNAKVMACNNIRQNTMPFYTFLGYHPDQLKHYYRLSDRESYMVADVAAKVITDSEPIEGVCLEQFKDIDSIKNVFSFPEEIHPHKDLWYVERRYFSYPYYRYMVYGIKKDDIFPALAVFRLNEGEEGNVLRLVDYIGRADDFRLLGGQIDPLMKQFDCEYCDMYSFGVDGSLAGFTERSENDVNIIPNYLDPLWKKNIDYFFFTSDTKDFMMFKADGDQDRKNLG